MDDVCEGCEEGRGNALRKKEKMVSRKRDLGQANYVAVVLLVERLQRICLIGACVCRRGRR